jgi:hypothetical protein
LTEKNGSGCDAISLWSGGAATLESRNSVLMYCANDVKCLAELYGHIREHGEAYRVTKGGNRRHVLFSNPPLSVLHAVALFRERRPDCSWMSDPPDVAGAVGWLGV